MLVSYKWLSEYVDLTKVQPSELADKMSRTGIEVEGIEVPKEGLKKIVVGDVKECTPHPNSDHLSICQVDIGEEDLAQIVCGAPNIKAGVKVIVALPGSRITGNVKIKKGKMRGEVSNGMICSLQELGYSDSVVAKAYSEGIFYLPEAAVPGDEVFHYLDMDDAIVDLAITPNRADALSMRGVAYEVGALYQQTPHFECKEVVEQQNEQIENYLSVEVENQTDTPTYTMRLIKDVTIKESPLWLQTRLMNAGIRPINNIVDVTNFVLLEFGQPMHAFDYDKIGSKEILVRRAKEGETLTTLDEEERTLTPENIVVTNGYKPLALAGVMGGLESEITDKTTTVALESALFDAVSIRQTAKIFHLRSESSSRFEKGINPATVKEALDFASAMMVELGGGQVVSGVLAASEYQATNVEVPITLARINDYLGTELNAHEVGDIFVALGFSYTEEKQQFIVSIPPRRWDISIEADIIEEVARIYGYDALPSTLPSGQALAGSLTKEQRLMRESKQVLEGAGLFEAISYVLTTKEKATDFRLKKANTIAVDWPMTEEHAVLRQNLVSGLLDDIAYNQARKNGNVAFYELGRVFYQADATLPIEENHLAFALTGLWQTKDWQTEKQPVDFFLAKGVLEELFKVYGIKQQVILEATDEFAELHPGRTAKIILNGQLVGFIGQVHPEVAKRYDIMETYVAELDLETLFSMRNAGINYQVVSKYPAVKRDIAILVDTAVTNAMLTTVIQANGGNYLQFVELFDVYAGSSLGENKKSMAYSLTFLNSEATLVDEDVTKAMAKVERALVDNYQVEIR